MKSFISRLSAFVLLIAAFGVVGLNSALAQDAMAHSDHKMSDKHTMKGEQMADKMTMSAKDEVTVVKLAQTPGEFTTKHLDLTAGQYTFEVTNEGVDHEVGFFIQKAADKDGAPGETAVENSFTERTIPQGESASTGVVTLTPGEYVYSCPLNPTPHYTITVK